MAPALRAPTLPLLEILLLLLAAAAVGLLVFLVLRTPRAGGDPALAALALLTGELVHHLLDHLARALAHLVERVHLRAHRAPGLTTSHLVDRLAHRPLRATQTVGDPAGPFGQGAHHLAELLTQRLLFRDVAVRVALAGLATGLALLPGLALLARLATLLAALTWTLLLRAAKAAIGQLLLPAHHLLQPLHHLAGALALTLAFAFAFTLAFALLGLHRLAGAQVFEHLLQALEHVACLVARPGARHLTRLVEHALKIHAVDALGVAVHPPLGPRILRIAHRVLEHRLEIAVDGLLQFADQALDLLVALAICDRVLQALL